MGGNMRSMATRFRHEELHMPLREISPIDDCVRLWREIQFSASASSTTKIQAALTLGAVEGERNARAFELARSMRDAGYSESETIYELQEWDKLNTPPISDIAEISTIVRSTFRHRPLSRYIKQSNSLLSLIRNEIASLNLSPAQHTAVIQALASTNTKRNVWNGYSIEAGELIISLQSLANRADVKKSQVRSMIAKVTQAGFITTSVLGNRTATKLTWQGEFAAIFKEIK